MDPPPAPSMADARAAADKIPPVTDTPVFCKEKHISYWLRCLRTPLPHHYISNDSNRLTLAFFIVSALDLLGVLHTRTTLKERQDYVDWIYCCQHPDGGFRAFPGTDFGEKRSEENQAWDPANLPGTYFALAALAILGDDLRRVRRGACLQWLCRLQRSDGSFGQTVGLNGSIEGGMDTRFGYCAMGVRWILRGHSQEEVEGAPDVNCDALVRCIRESETYDGSISDEPFHEGHAGFTYCAVGALSFLGRVTKAGDRKANPSGDLEQSGLSDPQNTIRWLMCRMTTLIELDQDDDAGEDDSLTDDSVSTDGVSIVDATQQSDGASPDHGPEQDTGAREEGNSSKGMSLAALNVSKDNTTPQKLFNSEAGSSVDLAVDGYLPDLRIDGQVHWAGFNGRVNKVADTCYAFWVGGSLSILGSLSLVDSAPVRRFLLEKTQHKVMGGFGKNAGNVPDVFHSYLGLAAFSLLGMEDPDTDAGPQLQGPECTTAREAASTPNGQESQKDATQSTADESRTKILRRLDPTLCISVRARDWIESLIASRAPS